MLNLPLDPTDDRAKPAFQNVASCTRWLKQLQFTNLHAVHSMVRTQLDEFNRYPMQGLERLRTLELLRETVSHLQSDYTKKIAAKKLPLSEEEFAILASITALWQQMVNGYHRCLQSLLAGDKQLMPYGSMLCQRCMLHTSLQIFECLHNGYEFEGRLWQQLHVLYAFCEEKNWHLEKLKQLASDHHGNPASCHVIYVKTLLGVGVYPGELSRAQLQLADRLLLQWGATVPLDRHFTTSKGDAPPLAVDLSGSRGLELASRVVVTQSQTDPSESTVRYLAMVPLSKLLRVKTILLQQGQAPQQLDLGDDCNNAECIALLKFLHRRWCEGSPDGVPRQHGAAKPAEMCYGIEVIYTRIAKKPSRLLDDDVGTDSLAHKQVATFGRALSRDDQHDERNANPLLETWKIVDESMLGAVMLREGTADLRLGLKQIVAVQSVNAGAFILGTISWLQVTQSGHLSAGVNYLPGVPQAIKISGIAAKSTTPSQSTGALLLPAVTTLKIPSSLIIPRDWFTPERVIELANLGHQKLKIKMGLSIEIGQDYERVSFTPV